MNRLLRLTAVLALAAPLLLFAGCKQGVGDRCQVQSDCDDGLLCVLQAGATPQAGGTCQMPGTGADMAATTGSDMAGAPPADMLSSPNDLTPTSD
jgi:hypothetical protein